VDNTKCNQELYYYIKTAKSLKKTKWKRMYNTYPLFSPSTNETVTNN